MGASRAVASEYDAFAPYYDAFTAESNYEVWTEHVLGVARRHGLTGTAHLDLACGTGKSFVPFVERGFSVTGCDLSRAMLDQAARKAPDVTLVPADIRGLGALGAFDLVTCFDDALNYVLEETELASALGSIAANLDAAGVALFDLNTLLAYRTTFAGDRVSVRDGTVFAWAGKSANDAPPGCRAAARLDIFVPRGERMYERVEVHHVQRHYPRARVEALLAAAGLACEGVYGVLHDGTPVPDADEASQLKVLYVAKRARGGDAR